MIEETDKIVLKINNNIYNNIFSYNKGFLANYIIDKTEFQNIKEFIIKIFFEDGIHIKYYDKIDNVYLKHYEIIDNEKTYFVLDKYSKEELINIERDMSLTDLEIAVLELQEKGGIV